MASNLTLKAPSGLTGTVITPDGATWTIDASGYISVAALWGSTLLNAGFTITQPGQRNNLSAVTDPGAGNDNTQDFQPGSLWINTSAYRVWMCLSAATGAAVWLLDGVVPGLGADPSNMITLFGGLGLSANFGTFKEEGNIYRAAGFPLGGNKADTTDDILCGIALDAGALDIAGRGLCITCQGTTGATTNNKRFKLFVNPTMSGQSVTAGVFSNVGTVTAGTPLVDSGAWVNGTTPNNAVGWSILANIFKYGATGSNTQYGQGSPILGTLHGGIQAAQALTLTESGLINIVVTGSSYTTGAANDVLAQFFEVNAMN